MKKGFLPWAWLKQIYFDDNMKFCEFYMRFGKWMASDVFAEIKWKIHLTPSLCIHFNHSEFFIQVAFLNFDCHIWLRDWRRADAYQNKLLLKAKGVKAKYKVGDVIEIIPTGRVVTIRAITDRYYHFGYSENGTPLIGDLQLNEQYRLYKPTIWKRLTRIFR